MSKGTTPSDEELFEAFVDEQKKLYLEHADDANGRENARRLSDRYANLYFAIGSNPPNSQIQEFLDARHQYIQAHTAAKTAVRQAADRTKLLESRSPDSADTLFHFRFLFFFGHCALDDFVRDLKVKGLCSEMQEYGAVPSAASHVCEGFLSRAMQIQEGQLWKSESMKAKESFERVLAFAAYHEHSCAIRQKLLDARAGKIGGPGDLKAQIRQLKKMRQPFEDVIKSAADDVHYDPAADSSIRDLLKHQEQLKDINFNSKQTTFQKMLKMEERWENELGFVKK